MGRRASSFDFEEDEEGHEVLQRAGKALQAAKLGKDQLLRTLKSAGEHLAEASQSSDGAKLASRDLAKALGRPELLRHKDKEVRLYAGFCLCHILRLNAPDTPYSDEQLQSIFELLNSVYGELEDPTSPHFQLCLSVLETVSQVKCSLLILDLPNWEDLTASLFSTLMDVVNEENAGVLQGTVVELLRVMIEEADELPQALLDVLLSRLMPGHRAESPAGHALAAALLQRTETTVQPYLQKFLTALLLGGRTDSELKGDYHSLFYAIHETVPQALLPLLPLLRDELEADGEGAKRGPTVELVARLFTQHPSGAAIIEEYPALLEGLLGRACDKEAEVRRKVLEYAPALVDACGRNASWQGLVVRSAVGRLYDVDDSVRRAAVSAVGALLQARPSVAGSQQTEGRGNVLSCLMARLRDKKMSVRREAASQLGALLREWSAGAEGGAAQAPPHAAVLSIPLVLCNIAVRDTELGAHIFDTVFRGGVFAGKLPPAEVARCWAAMWRQAGEDHRPMLARILQGKANMQRQVQLLVALRAAAKEHRTSSLAGAGSSMGAGAAAAAPSGSLTTAGGGLGGGHGGDPEARLQALVHDIAAVLKDVSRPEEGLQKLLDQKDNHIFRGLATLATYGCTFKDAVAAGKDAMQRVGSKGPAAELVRVLVARLTPNLLSPEVLHAAMEAAAQSEEVQHFLVDIAAASPALLAQSIGPVVDMFEADDPALAECAAKVLARSARHILAHCAATKQAVPAELAGQLKSMCTEGSPSGAKAAVKALVAVLGPDKAAEEGAELADRLVQLLKAPATLRSHTRLLAALKGLSMLGRLLPPTFERVADEVLDFVVADLMDADVSRGKPLAAPVPGKTGRQWRHPSPSTAIKCAALRTLCQALVPDSTKAKPSQAMAERAQIVWEHLEQLLDTDVEAEQFKPFAIVFPRASDLEQQEARSKRRRVEGGASDDEEEAGEEEELDCTDAAWVRHSAVCGLLRLARAYDAAMPASLYANLALTFQEPLVETRRAMTAKLARAVGWLTKYSQSAQRSAKYAAILALMAIDPEDRNRATALRTLRDYVMNRRAAVARLSAATAAAGVGGDALLPHMPEFMLPFLIFLLAHHPDYPTAEVLEEYAEASPGEQEEMYQGGTPFTPFVGMMQFALEALVVPSDNATSPAEVARHMPALLKMLRSLKFCDDASPDEPHTPEAHQLCDVALVLLRQIAGRLTKDKPADPGRFPGQVILPRMCFRPNTQGLTKKADGSDLPEPRYFTAGLYQGDLFLRRLQLMPGLPGPPKGGGRQRTRPAAQQPKAKRRKAAPAAEEEQEESEGQEATAMSDDESVGGTPAPERAGQAGSGGRQRKPAAAAGQRGRGQGAGADADAEGVGSGADSAGGASVEEEEQRLAPRTKKVAAGGAKKRSSGGRTRAAAPTPTRQQPRRGAKPEAAGRLRDESSAEDEEEQQQQQQSEQELDDEAVGSSQETEADEEDLEQYSRQLIDLQPPAGAGGGGGTQAAAAGRGGRGLRADTEDETEERGEAAQHKRPAAAGSRQPPKQQQQRQQQQQQQAESPGQENRVAGNGGAARRGAGGGKAAPKGKAAAAAGASSKGKGKAAPAVKPALKRARA